MASRQVVRRDTSVRPVPAAALTAADRESALKLISLIMAPGSGRKGLRLARADGETVELSAKFVTVLEVAAGMVASGAGVAVLAADRDLTSQEAADVLGVSRQYMVRLIDRGDIPSSKVGAHRRVKAADLAEYRARRDRGRRSALDALAADAEVDGAYGVPIQFGPRRNG